MMHIRSGIWKGRKILTPSQNQIRPTSDKVRQALFNLLRPRIRDSRFLDFFCGSGSVGITALSEGATFVAFVEKNPECYSLLHTNLTQIASHEQYSIYKQDVKKMIIVFEKDSFDIIFADPFYKDTRIFVELAHSKIMSLLKKNGLFILEHSNKISELSFYQNLEHFQETKPYGSSALSIFKVQK